METKMQVTVTYAEKSDVEIAPFSKIIKPYGNLNFAVQGDIEAVASWIDEHIIAGSCVMAGLEYTQGAMRPAIIEDLKTKNVIDYNYGVLLVNRE